MRPGSLGVGADVAGQRVGIRSDVPVARELESGAVVRIADFAMSGLGLYLAYAPDHPRRPAIERFLSWVRADG